MTITHRVQGAFFDSEFDSSDDARLIRLAPNAPPSKGPTRRQGRPWTNEEHDRFLHAMEKFPSGPWKDIAAHVGTRTTRQTMTHAQKYRQKIERWKRGATIKPTASVSASASPSSPASITPPSSPQSTDAVDFVLDDANEDAVFWQMLHEILEENDGRQEQSMVSLLGESQPMQFAMAPSHFASVHPGDYFFHDVGHTYEEFGALV